MSKQKARVNVSGVSEFEESISNFTLNPDYYAHLAIEQAINAIPNAMKENRKDGITTLMLVVDQLENIVRAKGHLDDDTDYKEEIKEFIQDIQDTGDIKTARIANFKLKLLMGLLFGGQLKKAELLV